MIDWHDVAAALVWAGLVLIGWALRGIVEANRASDRSFAAWQAEVRKLDALLDIAICAHPDDNTIASIALNALDTREKTGP